MPLSFLLRPTKLEDFIGQEHIVGKSGPLTRLIQSENIPSMIFWGPPASGKTTLAEIIAHTVNAEFVRISAVTDGKSKLMDIVKTAQAGNLTFSKTIVFVDEIHRWNKAQQDTLLPYVENGSIILIGATTENPSFTVISPLLSRSRVFIFQPHSEANIIKALKRGISKLKLKISNADLSLLASLSNGDMRFALNSLEIAAQIASSDPKNPAKITREIIESSVQKFLRHDKSGEEHYNIISAIHKSLRSSNATAAVYWIMRMLAAGDDPLYIARRLLRFASEDIGNANPNALLLANQVYEACNKLGMPECETALVQLAEYLADSPKNNSAYVASQMAKSDIEKYGNLPVPIHFRNPVTKFMKNIGYGKGYEYDPDLPNKKSTQQCLPDELKDTNYFPVKKD